MPGRLRVREGMFPVPPGVSTSNGGPSTWQIAPSVVRKTQTLGKMAGRSELTARAAAYFGYHAKASRTFQDFFVMDRMAIISARF